MRIILLGAPGAGKGTQCKRIITKYGLQHLSSGDILRQNRAEGTELGRKAQSFMDSGALVPDEIIVEMMIDAIEKACRTATKHAILTELGCVVLCTHLIAGLRDGGIGKLILR